MRPFSAPKTSSRMLLRLSKMRALIASSRLPTFNFSRSLSSISKVVLDTLTVVASPKTYHHAYSHMLIYKYIKLRVF